MAENDHAIVVGIGIYPGLSPLEGPCEDAKDFYDWLIDPDCGDVPPANVEQLLSTDFHPPDPAGIQDVHPLEEEVSALFRPHVQKGIAKMPAGRRLYIYMAGHGFGDPDDMNSVALYAADAEPTYAPHIAGTVFAEWFRRNAVFEEIVLFMDCCRTVIPYWPIRPPLLPKTSNPGQASKVRTVYAFATNWALVSRERDINGVVRGIFTVALLNALRNARPNQFGHITGQVIKDYVHNTIDEVAGDVEIEPPDIHVDSRKDITFIKSGTAGEFQTQIDLNPFVGGEVLVVQNGAGDRVYREVADASPVVIPLKPGFYKAFVENTARSNLFEIGGDDVEFTL